MWILYSVGIWFAAATIFGAGWMLCAAITNNSEWRRQKLEEAYGMGVELGWHLGKSGRPLTPPARRPGTALLDRLEPEEAA